MRYRVFMMLLANGVAGHEAQPSSAQAATDTDGQLGPERRVRALQLDPKRIHIEQRLLPFVADVSVLRASVLPPSDRIAVHLQLFHEQDPATTIDQLLHVRANTLWPVARMRNAAGQVTQVSLLADRRGRVKTEYRAEGTNVSQLIAAQHAVTLDRAERTARGVELHGRAWHLLSRADASSARAFSALVRRDDIGYTFDLGKVGGHWLRVDVRGERLTGLSAVSAG